MKEFKQPQKVSIRFFNDREIRAAWDYDGNRWLFSVIDVIAMLTESRNPRNYWKVMKHRLTKEGIELVTRCNQLTLVAADGKCYLADCLPKNEILMSLFGGMGYDNIYGPDIEHDYNMHLYLDQVKKS